MGGYIFSEEKEDDVDFGRTSRKNHFCYTTKPVIITTNSHFLVTRMSTTPSNEDSSNLLNYGILPNLVIMKISVFLPGKDLINFFRTSKLIYHCTNSNLCWKKRYRAVFERRVKSMIEFQKDDLQINWKKFYFIRHRKYSNDYFKEMYRTNNLDQTKSTRLSCCLLGSHGVGKTTFVHRLVRGVFDEDIPPTIGASFFNAYYCRNSDNTTIALEIWDSTHPQVAYRGTSVIFVCFSLGDRKCKCELSSHIKGIRKDFKGKEAHEMPLIIILGLKSDLLERRNHGEDKEGGGEILKFVEEYEGLVHGYVELSSKSGENFNALLSLVLDLSIRRIEYLGVEGFWQFQMIHRIEKD